MSALTASDTSAGVTEMPASASKAVARGQVRLQNVPMQR